MSGFELTQTIASVATVVAVVLTWLQLIQVRKQARTTFEDKFTEQYRKIMEDIPLGASGWRTRDAFGEHDLEKRRTAISTIWETYVA
jgi:hypothetical protein